MMIQIYLHLPQKNLLQKNLLQSNQLTRNQILPQSSRSIRNQNLPRINTSQSNQLTRNQILSQKNRSIRNQNLPQIKSKKCINDFFPKDYVINKAEIDNISSCSICLEQYQIGEKTLKLRCGHIFHADCLNFLLNTHNTCPICRQTIIIRHIFFEEPSSLTFIEYRAFKGCSSLIHISIPSFLESIGSEAFSASTLLKHIIILSSVSEIGSGAFDGCSLLAKIIFAIPSSLNSIGDLAFSGCSSLKQISFPSSVFLIKEDVQL